MVERCNPTYAEPREMMPKPGTGGGWPQTMLVAVGPILRVGGQWGLEGWFSLSSFLAANAAAEMDERPTL